MSHIKDLIFFSDDVNSWNFSPLVLNPNINPYKNKALIIIEIKIMTD